MVKEKGMDKSDQRYQELLQILKEEVVPAVGCTESIAIALCAAKTREVLGCFPETCLVEVSGNILKNAKRVIVPNTGGLKGVEAAAAAGIVAGKPDLKLGVIAVVLERQKRWIREYLEEKRIRVKSLETEGELLDIRVHAGGGDHEVEVRIAGTHTNIVLIRKDGEILLQRTGPGGIPCDDMGGDRSVLSVSNIVEFADSVDIADVAEILSRQVQYNMAISREGLTHSWGANVGKVLLASFGMDVHMRARAGAAAGADARMSGCEMPVMINSGSGNQGIAVSVPVIEYARSTDCTDEKLYRSLVVSNLIAIHQTTGIGRLSAYCGAVCAGAGAGCGIAYLLGGDENAVAHTLINTLATLSGMVCDGVKPSCAAKIASAVDAGILGYEMFCHGQKFRSGEGIVSSGVEDTIQNVGRLGSVGMRGADREIMQMMDGMGDQG